MTRNRKKGEPPTRREEYKTLKNRSGGKIELLVKDNVVPILPKGTVRVPKDFDVPRGIGLFVI